MFRLKDKKIFTISAQKYAYLDQWVYLKLFADPCSHAFPSNAKSIQYLLFLFAVKVNWQVRKSKDTKTLHCVKNSAQETIFNHVGMSNRDNGGIE